MLLLYYHPHPTGLTYLAQQVAEGLAGRGHEVTVLVARHTKDTPLGESTLNGVRIIRLWAPISISRGFIMPTYPWKLYRLLREHDVVTIFTPMFESALAALLAGVAGLGIVASHTSDLILPKSFTNSFVTSVMSAIFRFMARRAACIISLSEDYADNSPWLAPYRSKVRAIYPPIIIPEPDAKRSRQLRERFQHNGGPLIGFSGRFVEEKRPELLIHALQIVNKKYPDTRLLFTGQHEIPYEDTWERHRPLMDRFSSQLKFLGLLETKQELVVWAVRNGLLDSNQAE
jgi:glycosyltransferase involved in cell wall biosynthesis